MGKEHVKVGKKKSMKLARLAGKSGNKTSVGGNGAVTNNVRAAFGGKGQEKGKGKGKGKGQGNRSSNDEKQRSNEEVNDEEEKEGERSGSDSDVGVGEDDVEFFEEHAQYSSFLTDLNFDAPIAGVVNTKRERNEVQKDLIISKKIKKNERAELERAALAAAEEEEEEDFSDVNYDTDDSDDDTTERFNQSRSEKFSSQNKIEEEEDELLKSKFQNSLPIKMPDGRITYQYNYENKPNELKKPTIVKENTTVKFVAEENQEEEEEEEKQEKQVKEEDGVDIEYDKENVITQKGKKRKVDEEEKEEDNVLFEKMSKSMINNRLIAQKQKIALLCETILSDPEAALKNNNTAIIELETKYHIQFNLKKLYQSNNNSYSLFNILLNTFMKNDPDIRIRELTMISIMAVLRDIIPSYRIRLPTIQEKTMKVSKEIKKLRDYEFTLISYYQFYLKYLESSAQAGNKRWCSQTERDHAAVAMKCLGELLLAAPHFNFRSNILKLLCNRAGSPYPNIRQQCCSSLSKLFAADQQGDLSLEAVKQIAKALKDGKYAHSVDAIETFLQLKLESREDSVEEKVLKKVTNAKEKKMKRDEKREITEEANKTNDELEMSLREADASVDEALLQHCMKESLKEVAVCYFRILKQVTDSSVGNGEAAQASKNKALLPCALAGLAQIAHLVNVDTIDDLLSELRLLLSHAVSLETNDGALWCIPSHLKLNQGSSSDKEVDELPLDAALNCIRTAMRTLYGGGQSARFGKELGAVDEHIFASKLFSLLLKLVTTKHHFTSLLVECVELVALKRKDYSNVRIGAFIHRLLIVALQVTDSSCATPLVALARALITRYPMTLQLLESDDDRTVTGGSFKPLPLCNHEDLPELSNPFSAACWELSLLSYHWYPIIHEQCLSLSQLKPPNSLDNPLYLCKLLSNKNHYKKTCHFNIKLFYPNWKMPSEHSLKIQLRKQMNMKEKNRKKYYIDSLKINIIHNEEDDDLTFLNLNPYENFTNSLQDINFKEYYHSNKLSKKKAKKSLITYFNENKTFLLNNKILRYKNHLSKINKIRNQYNQTIKEENEKKKMKQNNVKKNKITNKQEKTKNKKQKK